LEERAAHRAPGHPVARRAKLLGSAAIAAALFGLPLVAAAPAEASVSSQWPLQLFNTGEIWNITRGSGVTIAELDGGVTSLPDTEDAILPGADFSDGTTSTGNGETDLDGHGTAMAAIMIGAGNVVNGLAPGAKLIPVRVTSGETGSPDTMAAGVRYAIAQHVGVINISQRVLSTDASLADALQAAINANIVVVAASGNETQSSVDYPAAYPGVVAVGAVDQSNTIWSESNTGPQVTLAAPGVNVPTEDNTGAAATASGTSASTAYVSATVALIRADHPSWTAGQVIRDLIATADPAAGQSPGQHSDQYGYGIVDPLKALEASAPTQTSNPLLGSSATGSTASAAPRSGADGVTPTAAPSSSARTGVVIGIAIALVIAVLATVLIVALSRRSRNKRGGGPRGGPGGPGMPGGPGAPLGAGGYGYGWPAQQQPPRQGGGGAGVGGGNPYHHENPYQQSPPQQYRPQQQPQNPYPPQQQ
jgi:subtilisin family serine protease